VLFFLFFFIDPSKEDLADLLQHQQPIPYGIYCIPTTEPDKEHWEVAMDAEYICVTHTDLNMLPTTMVAPPMYYSKEKKYFDEIKKEEVWNLKRTYYEVWRSKKLLVVIFKKIGERDLFHVPILLLKPPADNYLSFIRTRNDMILVKKENWPLAARCAQVFENKVDFYYSGKRVGNHWSFSDLEEELMAYEGMLHDGWGSDLQLSEENHFLFELSKVKEENIKDKLNKKIFRWFE
jgi:hypothetical protein